MRKGSDIIGKPIVIFNSGKQLCRVQDLIFDQNQNRLVALLVEEKSLFSGARVLPIDAIQSIGTDAVITQSEQDIVDVTSDAKIDAILQHNNIMKGTQILTVMGQNLGKMVDLYFDEVSGMIEGYEVSGGIFADAYSGRSFVPAVQTLRIGEDYAFVPAVIAELMEEQVGGIKGVLQDTGDKVQEVAQKAGDKLSEVPQIAEEKMQAAGELSQDIAQKAGDKFQELAQRTRQASAHYTIEQSLGRRVKTTVQTRNGVIIAAPGQVVTEVVIDRARNVNMELELLQSVGLSPTDTAADVAKSKANAVIHQAKDRLGNTSESLGSQVQASTTQFLNWAKGTTGQLRDQSAQLLEEQRIKGALGHPVTRVILDRFDRVILNTGELITHQAIAKARESDVLDMILGSVYTQTPEFSQSELRAPGPGQAALQETHPKEIPAYASGTALKVDYSH
jgi:uncharacterized protein YrrD